MSRLPTRAGRRPLTALVWMMQLGGCVDANDGGSGPPPPPAVAAPTADPGAAVGPLATDAGPLAPKPGTPARQHAWPLLPLDFAPAPALADHTTLSLRAPPGAIVRGMRAGTVTSITPGDVETARPLGPHARGPAGEITVTSSDGLRIVYIGVREPLVRPGILIEAGAPIGLMPGDRESTLQLRAARADELIAPLTLLGR